MQWFYDLKIGKKLILTFAVVIALTCVLGLFSISQLVKVNQASTDIATNWLPAVRYLGQMQTSMSRYRISESTHILLSEDADMAATEKSMATRLETLGKQQALYAPLVSEAEERRIYAEFQKTVEAYLAESKKLGTGVDVAQASGWPFGGPWVTPADACKYVAYQTYTVKGGEQLAEKVSFMQKPISTPSATRWTLSS